MKTSGISKLTTLFILIFLSISCSSDLDFDQINDFKLEPVVVANLAYFNIPANDFLDNGNEQTVTVDTESFSPFKNSLTREDLIRTEFNFEITNTINRSYQIDFILIDDQKNTVEMLSYNIPAYSDGDGIFNFTEVFQNQRLADLKRTTKINFVITMTPGPPLTNNSVGNLKLRSAATLYFEIEK